MTEDIQGFLEGDDIVGSLAEDGAGGLVGVIESSDVYAIIEETA